jgi:hypothetical protein
VNQHFAGNLLHHKQLFADETVGSSFGPNALWDITPFAECFSSLQILLAA